MMKTVFLGVCAWLAALPAMAQGPAIANPQPGCSNTPAQVESIRKLVLEFYKPGVDRVPFVDPGYIQHNPASHKRALENKMSDYDDFKLTFGPGRRGGGGGGGGAAAAGGVQPPAGNQLEIVTVECDIAVIIHKNYRQDPTAPAGTFYEAFTWDAYRVKNGKMIEHWDGILINPPAAGRGQ
jgi:predicted SnoaL-like aldol condensation-catalyzing enzyme